MTSQGEIDRIIFHQNISEKQMPVYQLLATQCKMTEIFAFFVSSCILQSHKNEEGHGCTRHSFDMSYLCPDFNFSGDIPLVYTVSSSAVLAIPNLTTAYV